LLRTERVAPATAEPFLDFTLPRSAPEVVLVWAVATTAQARDDSRIKLVFLVDICAPWRAETAPAASGEPALDREGMVCE